jgi:hypothetical protein
MRQIEAQIAAGGSAPPPLPGGGGGTTPPGATPLAPPPVDPNAGTFANWTPSQPVGMESPGAMYIPGLGFRAPVDPYDEALAAALQGRYPSSVPI